MRLGPILLFFVLAIACCSPGSKDINPVTPPPGLTDEVIIPADLAEEYQFWADQDWVRFRLPENLDELTLSERRGLMYYFYKEYEGIHVNRSFTIASMRSSEGQTQAIELDIIRRVSAVRSISLYFGERNIRSMIYDSKLPEGELAWLADWVLLNYPEIMIAYPDAGGSPAGKFNEK